jgi:hypothetical protein
MVQTKSVQTEFTSDKETRNTGYDDNLSKKKKERKKKGMMSMEH